MKRFYPGALVALFLALPSHPVAAQIGELRVNAGVAKGIESGGLPARPVGNASFSFLISGFSFGPEVLYVIGSRRIYGLGGVARVRLSSRGVRPYLVAGLGGNWWRVNELDNTGLFSGNLGAGIVPGPRSNFTVELRVYENLQRLAGGPGNWAFVTLTGGLRVGW